MTVDQMKSCCIEAYALGLVHGNKKTIGAWVEQIKSSNLKAETKSALLGFLDGHVNIIENAMAVSGDIDDMEA